MSRTTSTLIIGALLALIAAAFWGVHEGTLDVPGPGQGAITYGINGLTETRCIDGYRFIIGERGHIQQVLDGQGHGVKCGGSDGN